MRYRRLLALSLVALAPDARAQAPLPRADFQPYARILAMTDSRTFDSALVAGALAGGSPGLRVAAALAIGQTGRKTALRGAPTLRSLLRDPDVAVASNAAYALGLLVDTASIASLDSAVRARPRVAREAAWALGEIGGPAAPSIITALSAGHSDPALRIQLLLAAAKLRPVPVGAVRPYLADRNAAVVWAAAYSVARTRAPAGLRNLIELAGNPRMSGSCTRCVPNAGAGADAYVSPDFGAQRARAEIARALTRQAAGDSLATPAQATLNRLARDPSPHVRINAIRSLATWGAVARDALTAAASDRDANVRVAVAQSAATVFDSTSGPWLSLWSRDSAYMYRTSLAASAAAAGFRMPELDLWIRHPDWRYRASTAAAVAALRDSAGMRRVARSLIGDPDPRVRATGYGVLSATDTGLVRSEVRSAIIAALRDPHVDVRSSALDALRMRATAADLDAILASYAVARRDSSSDARISAARLFAALALRDSAAFTPDVRARLAALGAPVDPLEREALGSSQIFGVWPAISPEPRPLSWYENVVRTMVAPASRGRLPRLTLHTARGPITIELFAGDAPLTVNNILTLVRRGYYAGTRFHRVVPNFVAQDGDPEGTGSGGPGYAIRDEFNPRRYERGAVGMALSGPDTGGSQYFITHSPQPHLDGHYTVFGRTVAGWAALDALVQGDLIHRFTIQH